MSIQTTHDKLNAKLEEHKTQLKSLKDKLNNSSDSLKADLEPEIDNIEKMLINIKKHISQLGEAAEDEWEIVDSKFKGCWKGISHAIKSAVSKSLMP